MIKVILLLLLSSNIYSQLTDHDVYLTSNLCDLTSVDDLSSSLITEIKSNNNECTIILNGDLTSAPITTSTGKKELENLFQLLDKIGPLNDTEIIILTGDRDWNDNKPHGYDAVQLLNGKILDFIQQNRLENVKLLFEKNCPGPSVIELNSYIKLVAMNSQWWNYNYRKPRPADAICEYIRKEDVVEQFDAIIKETKNQNILVVAHHPIRSLGNYGGRYSLKENFVPFPILASAKNAYHANIGGDKDLSNDRLKRYTYHMYNSLYYQSNIIYASGHEHNHQVRREIDNIYINSGAPQNGNYVTTNHSTLLSENAAGYMRINYYSSGKVESKFLSIDTHTSAIKVNLFTSSCDYSAESSDVLLNDSYIPCITDSIIVSEYTSNDSTSVLPGEGYSSSWIKKLFLGKHHRPTWSTPVTIPYLRISEQFKNLTPYKEGNGKQTASLNFENENGTRFTFRSIDKQPRKKLDYELRKSIIGRIFKDQTSAQHPFGALPVAAMLDHLDILHASPKLYVLPNSDVLGPYQSKYGGLLGLLEENPGTPNQDGTYFANANSILKSHELFRKMYQDNSNKIDVDEFLRARLFDILVGDWDREEDNWKWAEYVGKESTIYRPIPNDRDQAFSKWDGVLPWLADREWGLSYTEGFDHEIHGMESLLYHAKHLDRFVMTEATKDDFIKEAKYIQSKLTNEVIISSVHTIPKASFSLEGPTIIEKLKTRRDDLQKYALQYYELLSHEVDIVGTVKKDIFRIYQKNDSLIVEVLDNNKRDIKELKKYYHRGFKDDETHLLKLYGLDGDDEYLIDQNIESDIKIKLLGGEGIDKYSLTTYNKHIEIIDAEDDVNDVDAEQIHITDNWARKRYIYEMKSRKFDSYFPIAILGYSNFNGFTLDVGARWTKHRWDKTDYHIRHNLKINGSTNGDYGLEYDGIGRHFAGHCDFLWELTLANPDFYDAYYGQGNTTVIDEELDAQDYYITTFNNYAFKIGIQRQFIEDSEFEIRIGYDYFLNKEIENTILTESSIPLGANDGLSIVPIQSSLKIDLRDDDNFARRGIRLMVDSYTGMITNFDNDIFTTIGGSYEQYFSTYNKKSFTLGLKVGGVKGIGDVPFYLQPRLGGRDNLRGFTSNRFFGRSSIYANSELRWNVLQNQDSSIPYDLGLSVFYDIGKVTNRDIEENGPLVWHKGYGFGLYVVPFDEAFALSMYFSWSEENTWYPRITLGTALN